MKPIDRLLALIAFAAFAGFLGIVAVKVARVDLSVIIAIGIALVAYDLWSQRAPKRR
ncbi:hypothetical protein [Mesorhizobium marinum]|uniref:Uncharacterized protein n=1 Tax=Mesorhizobium marinum TaxID=3228790 RepID=A0ABV3QYN2_9HYPH